jgi:predicted RNA binding protein YcfA (HicA-like mRNA interferase family)
MGFEQVRQKRSNCFYGIQMEEHIVPVHPTEKIGKGIINKIIKDAKITRDSGSN